MQLQDPIPPTPGSGEQVADLIKMRWELPARSAQQRIRDEGLRLAARRNRSIPVLDRLAEQMLRAQ